MFPVLCMYTPDVSSLGPPSSLLLLSFFCCQTLFSKKKKLFSPFYLCKTFMSLFSLLFHFFFSSLSVKTLQFFFSFLVSSFFFVAFSILFFRKINFSLLKNPYPTSPKLFFSISSQFKEKFQKLFLQHSFLIFLDVWQNVFFTFVCFEKHPFLFGERWGKTKTQVFPDLLVGTLPCFQKNLFFFSKNSWIETQKRLKREGKEVKPKREEFLKRRSKDNLKT